MARHIQLFGLASLAIADAPHEIEAFLSHPGLDRGYEVKGPILNRMLAGGLARQFAPGGNYIRSLRKKRDPERAAGQSALTADLDLIAGRGQWPAAAVAPLARFIAGEGAINEAQPALAYLSAYPFLKMPDGGPEPFDAAKSRRFFQLYERLARARNPASPRGFLARLTRGDARARRELLAAMGGNDYGLHAIAIGLDNSAVILANMRASFARLRPASPANWPLTPPPLRWHDVRTAPALVLRQITEDFTLPHIARRLPAYTLVLLRMRDAISASPPAGFEFAARQWSHCPAQRYLLTLFEAVWAAAWSQPSGEAAPQPARRAA